MAAEAAAAPPPAHVSARDAVLVAALEGAGRWHALALLRAARGAAAQALELWQRLSLGEVSVSAVCVWAVRASAGYRVAWRRMRLGPRYHGITTHCMLVWTCAMSDLVKPAARLLPPAMCVHV